MANRQHGLSRTLPKDFTYPSAGEPRTPERASVHLDAPPPPPRHSGSRLRPSRVRSGTDLFAQVRRDFSILNPAAPDMPLPSIEFPPARDASAVQYEPAGPQQMINFSHHLALEWPSRPRRLRSAQTLSKWSLLALGPPGIHEPLEKRSNVPVRPVRMRLTLPFPQLKHLAHGNRLAEAARVLKVIPMILSSILNLLRNRPRILHR